MKYYMVSDIHGNYKVLMKLIDELQNLREVLEERAKIYFLGDYIDGGTNSFRVLETLHMLQQCFESRNYKEGFVVLRGNHEDSFLEFLNGDNDLWLVDDREFLTTKTFLTEEQFKALKGLVKKRNISKICSYVRTAIIENHGDLIEWLKHLPYYYETEKQIIVHAGVDEEAEDLWEVGTPDYYFVGKYPLTTGKFIKDIVSGHVGSEVIANDESYLGKVYFDGESHFFIDGTILKSGVLPVLVYDIESNQYSSFGISCIMEDNGSFFEKKLEE